MQYYNKNIQICKDVINDVFSNIQSNTKMLVFGLGYDSKMWYEGNNKNTYFVENNDEYIRLNEKDIPSTNIIKYDYRTTCQTSVKLTDDEINAFVIPDKLLQLAPFDIIIIDGPCGYDANTPGRLIPCYWATLLSKPPGLAPPLPIGSVPTLSPTLIYVDDSLRRLESFLIKKYYNDKVKVIFKTRDQCTKIYF